MKKLKPIIEGDYAIITLYSGTCQLPDSYPYYKKIVSYGKCIKMQQRVVHARLSSKVDSDVKLNKQLINQDISNFVHSNFIIDNIFLPVCLEKFPDLKEHIEITDLFTNLIYFKRQILIPGFSPYKGQELLDKLGEMFVPLSIEGQKLFNKKYQEIKYILDYHDINDLNTKLKKAYNKVIIRHGTEISTFNNMLSFNEEEKIN